MKRLLPLFLILTGLSSFAITDDYDSELAEELDYMEESYQERDAYEKRPTAPVDDQDILDAVADAQRAEVEPVEDRDPYVEDTIETEAAAVEKERFQEENRDFSDLEQSDFID